MEEEKATCIFDNFFCQIRDMCPWTLYMPNNSNTILLPLFWVDFVSRFFYTSERERCVNCMAIVHLVCESISGLASNNNGMLNVLSKNITAPLYYYGSFSEILVTSRYLSIILTSNPRISRIFFDIKECLRDTILILIFFTQVMFWIPKLFYCRVIIFLLV